MNTLIVPFIATLLVMIVLVGCTKLLEKVIRRTTRMRAMIEASRRCAPVCRTCTVIDYAAELNEASRRVFAWKIAHPLGPRTMAETEEFDGLLLEEAGTRMLMAMDLDQPGVVIRVIEGS